MLKQTQPFHTLKVWNAAVRLLTNSDKRSAYCETLILASLRWLSAHLSIGFKIWIITFKVWMGLSSETKCCRVQLVPFLCFSFKLIFLLLALKVYHYVFTWFVSCLFYCVFLFPLDYYYIYYIFTVVIYIKTCIYCNFVGFSFYLYCKALGDYALKGAIEIKCILL